MTGQIRHLTERQRRSGDLAGNEKKEQGRKPTVSSPRPNVKVARASGSRRPRRAYASKGDAEAVIADARIWLAAVDISPLRGELATAVDAAIRYVTLKTFKTSRSRARSRRDRQSLAELLDRLQRRIPAELSDNVDWECRMLDIDPTFQVCLLTSVLVALSDILRAWITPWHHDVFRRFGIVSRPDGYPTVTPNLRDGEALCALKDELEHIAIPTTIYIVKDHEGDAHQVEGPASDAGRGRVSIDRLRAWRKVGLAKLQKEMELLPDPLARKLGSRYGPEWPFPCTLVGLSSPGARGAQKSINIALYLQVERFGVAPQEEFEPNEETVQEPDLSDTPPLPAFDRTIAASPTGDYRRDLTSRRPTEGKHA